MHAYIDKICCLVLLLAVSCVSAEVSVENGGYRVVVAFSQNISPQYGRLLMDDMKKSIEDASEILRSATGLGFSKVVFKIPTLWDTSEWSINITDSLDFHTKKSDILIDNANDTVFGKLPFAQQYGGCGIPGRQITIPTAFFDETNTFPKGISLAREWLKYRYGVFDENGYFADPLYPLYYATSGSDPNEVKITDCTNEPVTYNFLDSENKECSTSNKTLVERLNGKECSIKPDENIENITSSMMYFQEDIHTLLHICGKDTGHAHNSRSPNKQNALCYGQSIWDVVKKSPDFQLEANNEEHGDIEYIYLQEVKPKVVVAWENTVNLKDKKTVILNAIKQFMIDLPYGSKAAGIPFRSVPGTKYFLLRDLKDLAVKKSITDSIDSDFVVQEDGNINVAISTALDLFLSASTDTEGGTIIIITKSIQNADESVLEKLKDSKICLKFLLFNNDVSTDDIEKIKTYESASSCATITEFSTTADDRDIFGEMVNSMEALLPTPVDNKERKSAKIEYLTQESPITLHVDETIEDVTFWVFAKKESDNFYLKFNDEEKENAFKELRIVQDILALSYSPTEAGNIEFGYPHETQEMLTHVRVTTKKGKYFTGEIFIRDTSEEESVQMPVIIYAVIRFGAYPVQNAEVSVTIERPNNESDITFVLYDNGKGDPDITENDGIYSCYFTKFSEKGTYTVKVTVKGNAGLTTFGIDENTDYKSCCGSYVNGDTSALGEFTKEFTTTFEARSGRPDDGYKPSRISDLRIDEVTDGKVILKWTAPGEEADHGTASRYEIKLFCGEDNMTTCNANKMIRVFNLPPPLNYGKEQQVTIQITENTEILYVGIIAVNEKNKMSELSNIVEIFRPIDNPLEVTTTPPEPPKQASSPTGMIIGIVIPCSLIIICITAGIIFYFRRKSQSKKPDIYEIEENINRNNQEKKPTFEATDCSIKSAPVKKFESFPVLLYTHNQIRECKDKDKSPPLYKNNIPPKAWKSLDVVSNTKKGEGQGDRDTKSLGSSSTDTDNSVANGYGICD